MGRDTWRLDEKPEQKIYYSLCMDCGWEEQESHSAPDECLTTECPDCGGDYIVDETDYV